MPAKQPCCEMADIRAGVEKELSDYFTEVARGEFEGRFQYPQNVKDLIALFLAVTADHTSEDIMKEFDLSGLEECAAHYEQAVSEIRKDRELYLSVYELSGHLGIPQNRFTI